MKLFINILMIVNIIFLFYYLYKLYQLYKEEAVYEEERLQKYNDLQIALQETDKVKYWLYYPSFNLNELAFLYKLVVHKNYWLNEPFHSKFYELLMLIDNNDFMIVDPNSKVITINVRDKYNKVQTSKSYQVYNTRDIIKFVIPECIEDIKRCNKKDAQNLLISIFILALEKSVHCLSREVPKDTINKLLKNYEHSKDVSYIFGLIEEKDSQLYFIKEAFYEAFSLIDTLPYNDSEVAKPLQIAQELPIKFLQEI